MSDKEYIVPANDEITRKLRRLIDKAIPDTLSDKLILYNELGKAIIEAIDYNEKIIDGFKASHSKDIVSFSYYNVILNREIQKAISDGFKKSQEIFSCYN